MSAIVCLDAEVSGNVVIGDGCMIQPRASIIASGGAIVLGCGNIVEERALLATSEDFVLKIGNHNVFEVACRVESRSIGDANIIEPRAVLSPGSVIGSGCVIGAGVIIPPNAIIRDCTTVWGPQLSERIVEGAIEANTLAATRHADILARTLPKFHRMKQADQA
eukprot:TRINITY_DN5952_c0_g1_i1.p1 TRINITY_DN5952_c0_g1~~TRINITY_DN5952_c0_g1_i1.p1  ORF type:complete len:180 (-),score=29.72 TRINITY_DN5952_c0_g1_i1:306-797(-)